jgi:hypothetical protein
MYVETFGKCPMCSVDVDVSNLVVVHDVSKARMTKTSALQAVESRNLANG